jgi:hypothetical protein
MKGKGFMTFLVISAQRNNPLKNSSRITRPCSIGEPHLPVEHFLEKAARSLGKRKITLPKERFQPQ